LCIKAGTAYGNAFVESHNVFYIGVLKQTFQQWVFCGARISEYSVATVESEALHKHLSSSHGLPLEIWLDHRDLLLIPPGVSWAKFG